MVREWGIDRWDYNIRLSRFSMVMWSCLSRLFRNINEVFLPFAILCWETGRRQKMRHKKSFLKFIETWAIIVMTAKSSLSHGCIRLHRITAAFYFEGRKCGIFSCLYFATKSSRKVLNRSFQSNLTVIYHG